MNRERPGDFMIHDLTPSVRTVSGDPLRSDGLETAPRGTSPYDPCGPWQSVGPARQPPWPLPAVRSVLDFPPWFGSNVP